MKVKLNVLERLLLVNLLPAEGTFSNLKLLRVTREEISFTEKENKKLGFIQEGGNIQWSDTVEPKEIEFGEVIAKLVVNALKKLDKEEKLRDEHISLYEAFIKE